VVGPYGDVWPLGSDITVLTAVGCALLGATGSVPAAHAAKPGNTCPPGFNIGPVTIDEAGAGSWTASRTLLG
jgi:hypothetical protein